MKRTVIERIWQGESQHNPSTDAWEIKIQAWFEDVESVLEETVQNGKIISQRVVSQRIVGYGRAE